MKKHLFRTFRQQSPVLSQLLLYKKEQLFFNALIEVIKYLIEEVQRTFQDSEGEIDQISQGIDDVNDIVFTIATKEIANNIV